MYRKGAKNKNGMIHASIAWRVFNLTNNFNIVSFKKANKNIFAQFFIFSSKLNFF